MIHKLKYLFHLFECIFSEILFLFPSKKIKVIGVTGTDGKTTTAHLLTHILQQCGKKGSMVSSIEANILGTKIDTGFHTTTPRPFVVRKLLSMAVRRHSEYFIIEVTSHALSQGRIWGIPFLVTVLTNITHDHLYHHKSFENYFASKMKLLLSSKTSLVNRDCTLFSKIKDFLTIHKKAFQTYTTHSHGADTTWDKRITYHIPGLYNKENIMAAYAVCARLSLSDVAIIRAITSFRLPIGRFDIIATQPYIIIIDFAHTPHSLEQLLKSVKAEYGNKDNAKLVHIFGAASERDDSKRPLMGSASSKYADCIILTEEDFRHEPIDEINRQIAEGIDKSFYFYKQDEFLQRKERKTYTMVPDRIEAIHTGFLLLHKGDILVITGKSHEKSLNRYGKELPWDEYEAIKKGAKEILGITL